MGTYLRIPREAWTWQGTVLVLLTVLLPTAFVMWLDPDSRSIDGVTAVFGLATFPVMLAAGIIMYFAWRLTGEENLPWLSSTLIVIAIQGFTMAGLHAAHGPDLLDVGVGLVLVQVLFCAAAVVTLTIASDRATTVDPALVGFSVGIVSALAAVLVPSLGLTRGLRITDYLLLTILAATAMALLLTILVRGLVDLASTCPAWVRGRLVVGVLAVGVSQVVSVTTDLDRVGLLLVGVQLAGVSLVTTASLGVMRQLGADSAGAVADLRHRVQEVELQNREDRERLHELNASIAGIATASRLIHDPESAIPRQRRDQLQRVMETELVRLQQMALGTPADIGDVSLDDILEPVVLAQRIQGRNVDWSPTGVRASGDPRHLAEVLTTLLNNAARHAAGSPVSIAVSSHTDVVSIRVCDLGPGVADEVAERLFDFGARAADSPGMGIGLHVARRLVEDDGGSLVLVPGVDRGAVFEILLPPARSIRPVLTAVRSAHDAAAASA